MKLVLCTTLKKLNSTLQPNVYDADGWTLELTNVKFRAPVSVHSPVFIVRFPAEVTAEDVSAYNYAGYMETDDLLVPDWYLWIDDIVCNVDGTWTVSTHVDVLAQHKYEILENEMFVLRNANTFNTKIADTAMPTLLDDVSVSVDFTGKIFADTFSGGTFMLGVMNQDNAALGIPHYYTFTQVQWANFTTALLSSVDWLNISTTEISAELQKALVNPMQYITSALWIPCTVGTLSEVEAIPIGFWSIPNSQAGRWNGTFPVASLTFTLPRHPQASALPYLNYPPYSNYTLTVAPFGEILFPSWVEGGMSVEGVIHVDPTTGDATLKITAGSAVVGTFTANVAVPVELGQTTANLGAVSKENVALTAVGAVAGALDSFDGSIVGGVKDVATGILSGLSSTSQAVQIKGSHGTISAYIDTPRVQGTFKQVAQTSYAQIMGRPLCRTVKLLSLTGYTLCAYGNVRTTASPAEKATIASYLTSGFFIE